MTVGFSMAIARYSSPEHFRQIAITIPYANVYLRLSGCYTNTFYFDPTIFGFAIDNHFGRAYGYTGY